MQCSNNLKQFGLALHNHHDSQGFLPPGGDRLGFSTHAYLLSYMEQDNVFRSINFTVGADDPAFNAGARGAQIKTFRCPADPYNMVPPGWAATNYRANQGSGILNGLPPTDPTDPNYGMAPPSGPFYRDSRTKLTDISDGTSNTAAFSEHMTGDFSNATVNENDTFWPQTYPNTPDEAIAQCRAININNMAHQRKSNAGAPWLERDHTTTMYFHAAPPGDRSCMYPPGRISTTANSGHNNGVNVVLCDGSVRYVTYSISLSTWRAVGTRSGGEVLGNDW
jgi:prepilin-type processing-associated H-X9-DG protein